MKQFSSFGNIVDKFSAVDTNNTRTLKNVFVGVASAIFSLREDRAWNNVNDVFSRQKLGLQLTSLQVEQVDLSRLTSLALALATSSLEK